MNRQFLIAGPFLLLTKVRCAGNMLLLSHPHFLHNGNKSEVSHTE